MSQVLRKLESLGLKDRLLLNKRKPQPKNNSLASQHQQSPAADQDHSGHNWTLDPTMFILRGLEKILADRDIKKSHHAQLKKACEGVVEELKTLLLQQQQSSSSIAPTISISTSALPLPSHSQSPNSIEIDSEKYFIPFELACQSKTPRIVIISLDCLQKLIAYGHLTGKNEDQNQSNPTKLIDRIVSSICSCFIGPGTDEGVQLQIIKALLTVVTSQHVEVHEGTVLLTIRTCYNIYLASKSLINQTTARAGLSQMLSVVFQRMEGGETSKEVVVQEGVIEAVAEPAVTTGSQAVATEEDEQQQQQQQMSKVNLEEEIEKQVPSDQNLGLGDLESTPHSNSNSPLVDAIVNHIVDVAVNPPDVVQETGTGAEVDHQETTQVHNEHQHQQNGDHEDQETELEKTTHHQENGEAEEEQIENETNEREIDNENNNNNNNNNKLNDIKPNSPLATADLQLGPTEPTPPEDSVSLNTTCSSPGITRVPSLESVVDTITTGSPCGATNEPLSSSSTCTSSAQFAHIFQKDAFLVFRSLCKLSMKPLPDGQGQGISSISSGGVSIPDPKSHELRSKILSLQLLSSIISHPGPVFSSSPIFITAIRQYLCVSLSKNGVSPVPEVFQLSLSIFLDLLSTFKSHLKPQIEVFFKEILLPLVESNNSYSSFEHKWLAIQGLTRICGDAQLVVDLYVNYDCDISAANVFERIVNDLSKIGQGQSTGERHILHDKDKLMRVKGVEGLVGILTCMVDWTRQSNNSNLSCENNSVAVNSLAPEDQNSNQNSQDHNSIPNDNPTQFEAMKLQKDLWEQGILLFNRKPSLGLSYLSSKSLLNLTPSEIAHFLHTEDRLNKTVVGDYLGDPDKLNKQVMSCYVDQMDFKQKDLVGALRQFLEGFRLPGEAQKIDRLMEKFASRYCDCNPNNGIFSSADTAYVLAYSIIMLTTDLHSPQVKTKMTKEQYIKMNRGINDSRDLPEEYLSEIYDEIAGNEIKMKTTTSQQQQQQNTQKTTTKQSKKLLFSMELESLASTAKSLMESVSHAQVTFTSAKHLEHVRPMFKLSWTCLLAAFSVGLQDCDDDEISSLCLNGMRSAIHIACIFHMKLERDAFVQALARFTLLNASNCLLVEMKSKNINTIKTLITIGQTEGNYLGTSWGEILKCISQLEMAQLSGSSNSGSGARKNTWGSLGGISGASGPLLDHQHHYTMNLDALDPIVKDSILGDTSSSQSILVSVDRIFTNSTRLDGDAIVDFVKALCQVSLDELNHPSHPRMFSLQKIVEISYYNMGRIRLQWSRIWEVLGEHFNRVGGANNEEVAFFAIDSLRQLSMKFIEKGEFANFKFQKEFLRPFEIIMKRSSSPTIRDMVVRCITQMVTSQSSKIRSGWKNIFGVFHISASDSDPTIVDMAFNTTNKIIGELYEQNLVILVDSFQDAVKCLSEFACNVAFPDVSMEAIRLIRVCGKYVHEKPKLLIDHNTPLDLETSSSQSHSVVSPSDRIWVRGWFPILFELSCIVSRCNLDVRTRGLTVLFELIKTYGESFQPHWWKDLFQVIFRIFDNMKLPEQVEDKAEWMTTTCNHALFAIVDVFIQYFGVLGGLLLEELFVQLEWCVGKCGHEQLATSGLHCFEHLVISSGGEFSELNWGSVVRFLGRVFQGETSFENNIEEDPIAFRHLYLRAIVQVELIQTLDNILFFPSTSRREDEENLEAASGDGAVAGARVAPSELPRLDELEFQQHELADHRGMFHHLTNEQLILILDSLETSHEFAKEFNQSREQQQQQPNLLPPSKRPTPLTFTPMMHQSTSSPLAPLLLQQEVSSLATALRILFRMYGDESRSLVHTEIEQRIISTVQSALGYFLTLTNQVHKEKWTSLFLLLFGRIEKLGEGRFRLHTSAYYDFLCEMIALEGTTTRPEIKTVLKRYFQRIGKSFGITKS